jgi:hypothetical protein
VTSASGQAACAGSRRSSSSCQADGSPGCPLAVTEFWPRRAFGGLEPREILERYRAIGRELSIVSVSGHLEPASTDELLEREDDYVELALTRSAGRAQPLVR